MRLSYSGDGNRDLETWYDREVKPSIEWTDEDSSRMTEFEVAYEGKIINQNLLEIFFSRSCERRQPGYKKKHGYEKILSWW